ncbi:hypothetical protein WKH54_02880 [Priestia megaterium]|uniref:hypothetical protein n=1 Tax=Priestia megaterium TaxID=1404 RepID=UPI003177CF35
MSPVYKCVVNIDQEYGDIQINVSGDGQIFIFLSDLGSLILPQLFSELSSFYQEKTSRARLESYGNSDFYTLIRDSKKIRIEHVRHHPGGRDIYTFDLKNFVVAIDKGFNKALENLCDKNNFTLKSKEKFHPLGEDVVNAYHHYSQILKRKV